MSVVCYGVGRFNSERFLKLLVVFFCEQHYFVMLYCTWMYTDLDFKTDRRQSKERVIT